MGVSVREFHVHLVHCKYSCPEGRDVNSNNELQVGQRLCSKI